MKNNSMIYILGMAGILSISLAILKTLEVMNINAEFVIAPVIVTSLLAFGDKLLAVLLFKQIGLAKRISNKIKGDSQKELINKA